MRRVLLAMMWVPGLSSCNGEPGAETVGRAASAQVDTPMGALPVPQPRDQPPPLPHAPDSLLALAAAPDLLLDRLATREYSYDECGLLVHDTAAGWLLAVTADSAREWIRAAAVDRLHPLHELVVERLNYLTGASDGVLRSAPDIAARVVLFAGVRVVFPPLTPVRVLVVAR